MSSPGDYLPDCSAGLTKPEDLPQAKVVRRSRKYPHQACPRCGKRCGRDRVFTRVLPDVGDLVSARPRDIPLGYAQYHCPRCRTYCNADRADSAVPKAHSTHRVVSLAIRLVVEDGLPYQAARWHLWRDPRVFVPFATSPNWVETGGKKGGQPNGERLPRLGPG